MAEHANSTTAPIEHPALTKQRLRQSLTRLIDRLVCALDEIDGDPDLEDVGDDEPSLSASIPTLCWEGSQDRWLQGRDDDQEWQCEDEGGEHDGREPEQGDGAVEYVSDHDQTRAPGSPGWVA